MGKALGLFQILVLILVGGLSGCATQGATQVGSDKPTATTIANSSAKRPANVVVMETFLADITQNIAGDRLKVSALMPIGMDIHSFEPTPSDVAKVANADLIIMNGSGLEESLSKLITNNAKRQVIEASTGLKPRQIGADEPADADNSVDPHFWLDPVQVIGYVENIRDGLSKADPEGRPVYTANAEAYIVKLRALDTWVVDQVKQIPPDRRLLVTNHESFGYYADRYGFKVVGAIIPSVSTEASPSAQQLARLVDQVRSTRSRAIFLETGSNPQLAQQIAKEAGISVAPPLYTHSITGPDGEAPTYIDMIKFNTRTIVDALK